MKRDDKLVCIKNYEDGEYIFNKNTIYRIYSIGYGKQSEHLIAVSPIINKNNYEHYWFSINHFNDYFIDIKKYRKFKLQKINSL